MNIQRPTLTLLLEVTAVALGILACGVRRVRGEGKILGDEGRGRVALGILACGVRGKGSGRVWNKEWA